MVMNRFGRAGSALLFFLSALAALVVLSAAPVVAGFCGESVDGVRVACDCGDIAAGDVRLRPSDPIAQHRCPLDGLIVRAAPLAESVTIDLGGLAIVGSGFGNGLLVERGGSDGAEIVGGPGTARAEIVGFTTGIVSGSPAALARLERVTVKGNTGDGLRLRQTGAFLVDVESTDNGGNGIRIIGSGGRLIRTRVAHNRNTGIAVAAPGIAIDATTEDNGGHGLVSSGRGSDLARVVARGNAGAGVVIRNRQKTDGMISEWNLLGNVRGAERRVLR